MSKLPPFSRGRSSSFDLERLVMSLKDSILEGEFIHVSLKAYTQKSISKAPARGWIVVDKDANAEVWSEKIQGNKLTLIANADVNIKVWVF